MRRLSSALACLGLACLSLVGPVATARAQGAPTQAQPAPAPPKGPPARVAGVQLWPGFVPAAVEHMKWRLPVLEAQSPIRGGALFLGDSITEAAPLATMFPGVTTSNYGAGWDTTDGALTRLSHLMRNRPDRVFILLGTNDLSYPGGVERVAPNTAKIVGRLRAAWPDVEVYVISILPQQSWAVEGMRTANSQLARGAAKQGYVYLDLGRSLATPEGTLKSNLSDDGLHPNAAGYQVIASRLQTCVVQGCQGL